MLKPDLQHQFWVTKKAVQRKLGSKEDECIVSSDAELDSKIDLLKSIGDSCSQLKRIIDSYQEKMLVLAQEENAAGVFLKESGKHSATCSRVMCCAGKSISYSGQQHMKLRAPIVRLHHEVDTFTGRAIKDTYGTVQAMERERTEYRAALGWMKAASAQLDPDKGRGLDKFRNAQMYVRTAKTKFDTMTLDCLQKIDLLAAARCNMFSHVLVAYQAALLDYATKTSSTYQAALKILSEKTHYNFTVLKDLTQVPVVRDGDVDAEKKDMTPLDFDQMLFFKEEFEDNGAKEKEENVAATQPASDDAKNKIEEKETKPVAEAQSASNNLSESNVCDLLGLSMTNEKSDIKPEYECLLDWFDEIDSGSMNLLPSNANLPAAASSDLSSFDLFKKIQGTASNALAKEKSNKPPNKSKTNEKKNSAWMDLFADLDPLANPTSMEKKISGPNQNCLDA